MKTLLACFLVVLVVGATLFGASQKKEARVTQIIHDVRLLGSNASPRTANVNDNVFEGTAVRTGGDSRAELTFTDQTLTRIGSNTVFSFGEGGKQFDLASGAMLLAVPKSAGAAHVNIGAATAAVTGFTAMFEKGKVSKLIILEGDATIHFKGVPGDPCHLESGQMIVWPVHPAHCPTVLNVDIGKIVKTAKLVTMSKLPPFSWDPIQIVIDEQNTNPPPGGFTDPTNPNAVDQQNVGEPTPPPIIHVRPPPPSG